MSLKFEVVFTVQSDTLLASTTMTVQEVKQAQRRNPLADDLATTGPLRTKSKKRKVKRDDDSGDRYVDSRSSRKILKIGQDLADEEQAETGKLLPNPAFSFESRFGQSSGSDGEHDLQDDDAWGDEEDDILEEVVLGPKQTKGE